MLGRRLLAIVFAVFAARTLGACSMRSFTGDEIVGNETYASANGRFVAVCRHWDVPDFESARFDSIVRSDARKDTITVALYDGRRLIRELETLPGEADDFLVSDDGLFVVAVQSLRRCGYAPRPEQVLLHVDSGGQSIGALTVEDAFTSSDLRKLEDVTATLRHEENAHDVIVIRAASVERRVDLATVRLLDPVTHIFPWPHVSIVAASSPQELQPAPAQCAAEWNDPAIARIDPATLVERAVTKPLPAFPELLDKVGLRADVAVDVLVGEDGRVLCTRASALPFGGTEAATKAVNQWTFEPGPGKYAGQVLIRFRDSMD